MQSERRHELETNTLAKELNEWGAKIQPYSSAILIGVAVLVGIYAAYSFWTAHTAAQEREAWDEYQLAVLQGDDELRQVERVARGEDFAGSRMQEWAYITWADRQLWLAAREYLVNREAAKERLNDIAAIYEQFADMAVNADVKNRARLGLARVSEMQNDLDEARRQYALVQGPLKPVADARLKELESEEAEKVTQWLATVELPKRAPPAGGGLPGGRPEFEATLPDADAGLGDPFEASRSLEEILGGLTAGDEGAAGSEEDAAGAADAEAEPTDAGTATEADQSGNGAQGADEDSGDESASAAETTGEEESGADEPSAAVSDADDDAPPTQQ
jgi:hypothetical protein